MSETAKLQAAFVKAQAELQNPAKSASAVYGKYVPLAVILDQARAVLSRYGLGFSQEARRYEEGIGVVTHIFHESGERLSFGPLILTPTKNDPQAAGSTITYGCRYTLSAILGIAGDEDDDGQQASKSAGAATTPTSQRASTASASTSAGAPPKGGTKAPEGTKRVAPVSAAPADTTSEGVDARQEPDTRMGKAGPGSYGESTSSDLEPTIEDDSTSLLIKARQALGGVNDNVVIKWCRDHHPDWEIRKEHDLLDWHLRVLLDEVLGVKQ